MPTNEVAYRLAASLALDLIKIQPSLDEMSAINIAWEAHREDDPVTFNAPHYRDEVLRAMRDITNGRLQRVEPTLQVKARAQARLG